jgi:Fe2+ or Zn2+ uptake regulation protein
MSSLNAEPEDDQSVEPILDALSVKANRKILSALNEPMTAAELVEECDISSSTVYRSLDILCETGLVEEHLAVNAESGRCSQFKRNIKRVSVFVGEDNRLTIRVERASGNATAEKTWRSHER